MDEQELRRLQAIADRVEIIENLSRYHQAVDLKEYSNLHRVFTPGAEGDYVDLAQLIGVNAICEWLETAMAHFPAVPTHFMVNHVCDINGDTAHSRSFLATRSAGSSGVYDVDHVRTEAGWRISRLRLIHTFPEDWDRMAAELQSAETSR